MAVIACLFLTLSVVFLLVPIERSRAANGTSLKFTILHTNDEHSELIPYGPAIDYPDHPTKGGFDRVAHEIASIKAEKAAAGEPVLTLSGGDFSQGTLFAWLETMAAAELSLMQAVGYDAVALGNHEMELGPAYRAAALNAAKANGVTLPILCANIDFDEANPADDSLAALFSETDKQGTELAIQRYTVKEFPNGLKVGIFGLLGVEAEALAPAAAPVKFGNVTGNPEDPVSFINRVLVAQNMVNTLRAQGCQVVVALSHSGTREETELPKWVTGIDVIVGGHSHDLNYPPITVGNTIIVQAGAYTSHLGVLELEYDGSKVSVRSAQAIEMNDSVVVHPGVEAAINAYKAALNGALGFDMLAPYAETDFGGNGGFYINDGPPFVETNLGDLITDAYLQTAAALNPAEPPVLAFEANGVIRSNIPPGAQGRFSFYDLYRSLPLGGSPYDPTKMGYPLVSFYLFGQEIWGVLNATLDMGDNQFFVQLSGGRYRFRPAGPKFDKTDSARGKVDYLLIDGVGPINPTGLYKVATNFYTASFLALFGVKPRNNVGAQVDIGTTRVDKDPGTPGIQEIKCWEALAGYVGGMPDLDGDGLKNLLPDYRYTAGRISTPDWYLAEGATAGGMETYILVQNPGDDEVHARIKFLTGSGEFAPADLQDVVIPAKSRRTFPAKMWVSGYDVSTVVEPISPRGAQLVCERAMYGNGWNWAHDSIGVTGPFEPAPEWYFAEGSTGGDMETWLLVQNPYGSTIHVNITFQTGSGEVAPEDLRNVPIPARSRRTFFVNSWVDSFDVSMRVEALDGNVICERAMYGGDRAWATESKGSSVLSGKWYLAEGATAGGMETYILVQNPGDDPVHVNIAFQTGGGEVAPAQLQNVEIPGKTRRTFRANDYVTGYDVSTLVTCADGAVVVERAMYGGGWQWGHASIGMAGYPTAPSLWYLAEGATAGGMETYILVQNPGDDPVHVNIAFQTGGGEVAPAQLQNVEIPGKTRRTFPVNMWVTGYDVSTLVQCLDGKVVVERSMYGGGWKWGHCSLGYYAGGWK
ncbi:5'-nucleotidase C-terminal domain-containing protein [Candidatus Solincola tengchongensis]|uniref:5'-nucleotidase C-terminal domain-containing protein n=1 Tax=Candidatus Solincola tengchongensis TaxID=2900693 RepID=UPI00257B6DEF|nr:5'-nucleotidase C-terminal domain-containing protein [Candidatus Solincola tengchongensis]